MNDSVWLDEANVSVNIIDQTRLPGEEVILSITDLQSMKEAIYQLKLRGAPAIGVGAALFMYVESVRCEIDDPIALASHLDRQADDLASTRPTAVNLKWAIERMRRVWRAKLNEQNILNEKTILNESAILSDALILALKEEALLIWNEDIKVCRKIGEYGASLIQEGDGILTHCNAGSLATVRLGTATAPMYISFEQGKHFHVYCDETRPLLQGARLTAYELSKAGMDVTLLCDNMAASLMQQNKIQAIFVGCDRVAKNGDTANKIGTAGLAILAKRFSVPFYVCAPFSTIDPSCETGEQIVIEQRDESEVTTQFYKNRMAPKEIKVYNPAFDVTDHRDISAFITEKGILKPPFLVG